MNRTKKVLVIAGAALGGLLLVAVVLILLLPVERIGQMAVDQAEETLDREVRIEGFGIRFLPRPAVTVEGVAVSRAARPSGSQGASQEDFEPLLASVARIDLRPRLLPLLRGDVVVEEIALQAPHVHLVTREDGTLDLPELEEDPDDEAGEIEIRRVVIADGLVDYRDELEGVSVTLTGIEHVLSLGGAIGGEDVGPLVLEGEGAVAEVEAEIPEALDRPLRDLRLAFQHDLELDQEADRLEVRALDLTLQDFPVHLSGAVEALSDPEGRAVALEGRAEEIEVARLVESVPRDLREELPGAREGEALAGTAGNLDLELSVSGPVTEGSNPGVDGRLRLREVAVAYQGENGDGSPLADDLEGEVGFSLERVWSEGLTGRLLGEPFRLAFQVEDPGEEAHGSATWEGALDLAEAERFQLFPEGVEGSGRISVDLTAAGRLAEPDASSVDGSVQLMNLELRTADLEVPVTVGEGRIDLAGQGIRTEDLRLALGQSDLAVDLEVREWVGFALEDGPRPSVEFEARSELLDLNELTAAEPDAIPYGQLLFAELGQQEVEGRSAAEHAEELGLTLPELPHFRLDGRLQAAAVLLNELRHENLEAVLAAEDDVLEVPSARFETMGGRAELSAVLGAERGDGTRALSVEYGVDDVTADPFLEHHTLFRERVGGSLHLTGSTELELGSNTLPLRETVTAEGSIEIRDGELREWALVRELGESVGISDLGPLSFQDWRSGYRVVGASMQLEESVFQAGDLTVRSAGSFDVAGNLDFTGTFHLPRDWVAQVPGVPSRLLDVVLRGRDVIPVDATVTGSLRSPSIGLDFSDIVGP